MGNICKKRTDIQTELHIPIQQASMNESKVQDAVNQNSTVKKRVDFITQTQNNRNIQSSQARKRRKELPLLNTAVTRKQKQSKNFQELYLENLQGTYRGKVNSAGIPNGPGQLFFDNKDYLQGIFTDGYCEGQGRIVKADGSYYEGHIRGNVADGYGIFIDSKNEKIYQGQWKKNLPNGTGQASYLNGRYIGTFFNGRKHGQGILFNKISQFSEEQMYQGEFKNDYLHGKAKFVGQNGEKYQGQWKFNKKHGYGVYEWPDSSKYQGWYFQDKKQGQGKMKYSNGEEYQGKWNEGLRCGQGILRKQKDRQIKGLWKNGQLVQILS